MRTLMSVQLYIIAVIREHVLMVWVHTPVTVTQATQGVTVKLTLMLLMEPQCSGRGTCTDGDNLFTCDCNEGFTGLMCQTNIDDCVGVNCSGHGQCIDGMNNFTCLCQSGFTGVLYAV